MLSKEPLEQFRSQIVKEKKKLSSIKATNKDLKKKLDNTIAQTMEAEKEIKQAKANTSKTFDDYKKSTEFKEEVNEASSHSYEYSFEDCKAKVKEFFPSIDLKKVTLPGHEEEEEEEEEVAEEG